VKRGAIYTTGKASGFGVKSPAVKLTSKEKTVVHQTIITEAEKTGNFRLVFGEN